MKTTSRLDQIVSLIDEHSFLTVSELSHLCNVSEMTIRRDLEQLQKQKRHPANLRRSCVRAHRILRPRMNQLIRSMIRSRSLAWWIRWMC